MAPESPEPVYLLLSKVGQMIRRGEDGVQYDLGSLLRMPWFTVLLHTCSYFFVHGGYLKTFL